MPFYISHNDTFIKVALNCCLSSKDTWLIVREQRGCTHTRQGVSETHSLYITHFKSRSAFHDSKISDTFIHPLGTVKC
jgi:hypothetical protein